MNAKWRIGIWEHNFYLYLVLLLPMEIIAGVNWTRLKISQVAGVLLGQYKMPGFRTVFGLVVVVTFVTNYGARLKAAEQIQNLWKD